MIKLDRENYNIAYKLYQTNDIYFPLIAAVLLDYQDGSVYVDAYPSPSQVYVEHAFGFAQIFGKTVERFEEELERYMLIDKRFVPNKIRLFAKYVPGFLVLPRQEAELSCRQRFKLPCEHPVIKQQIESETLGHVKSCSVTTENISMIDAAFQVVNRFWRCTDDFIEKSNAVVVFYKGEPASICYAAALTDSFAEIDVLTLPTQRNLGLGRFAVIDFINKCSNQSLHPTWDCFTNNSGSMMLCKSVGFIPASDPYHFFTIAK
jgi:hypothetical protein